MDKKEKRRRYCIEYYRKYYKNNIEKYKKYHKKYYKSEKAKEIRKRKRKNLTLEKRFFSKIIRSNNCWEWIGSKTPNGYGKICIKHKTVYAHRVSYELHTGIIPDDMCILHSCDNPSCVNPEHLRIGTQTENIKERDMKGRHKKRTCGKKILFMV